MRIAGLVLIAGLGACAGAGAQQGTSVQGEAAPGKIAQPPMLQQAPAWTVTPRPFMLHSASGTTTTIIKNVAPRKTAQVCYAMRNYQFAHDPGGTGKPEQTGYETCAPATRLKTESVLLMPPR